MTTKRTIDKMAAKIAFDETVELTARVAAFASANFMATVGLGQVIDKAERLAQRDLILLSLSVRRLAEICRLQRSLKDVHVTHVRPYAKWNGAGFYPIGKKTAVWSLIGVLLHHLDFRVYKNDAAVKSLLAMFRGDIMRSLKAIQNARDIQAVCYIKSDKGEPVLFSVVDFVRPITDFIEEAEEVLGDQDIHVGTLAE